MYFDGAVPVLSFKMITFKVNEGNDLEAF